jgi:telomere length regulation protein
VGDEISLNGYLGIKIDCKISESIVEGLNRKLEKPRDESQRLQKLIFALPGHNKRSYMIALLQIMSSKLLLDTKFQNEDEKWWTHDMENVSGAAALLGKITLHDDDFRNLLMEWLTSTSGGGVGEHINIRRTIIAVMVEDQAASKELFEKSLQQFADKLWIKHIPIIRQEGLLPGSLSFFFKPNKTRYPIPIFNAVVFL